MKRGKKYVEAAKAVDRSTLYDTAEAISLVKKTAVAKFDETVEVHIRTGCDGRHADQQIREAVPLLHESVDRRDVRHSLYECEPQRSHRILQLLSS